MGNAVEFLNWRGRLIAKVRQQTLEPGKEASLEDLKPDRIRPAYFGNGWVDTSIYLGERLPAGTEISGPAVIEEATSTLVVYPGAVAKVSAGGRYIVTPPAEG
jgi:N-methylhydantoinase A